MEKVIDACNSLVYTTITYIITYNVRVEVITFINYTDCEHTDGF